MLVDGNRAQPRSAEGLLHLAAQALGGESSSLETAAALRLGQKPGKLCLLFDRYDALSLEERAAVSGPLRSLRDAFKYQLTFVIAARRPLDSVDELAELFYSNTLWLGPLSASDAHWSAAQYAQRRGLGWDEEELSRLAAISSGYPSLLRACCEAAAAGTPMEVEALRAHPAVQFRIQEFWADHPSAEDLRRSGLAVQPLLATGRPQVVSAESTELTASEHRLLIYFQAHPDEICTKDDLIRTVWPEDRVVDGLRDDSLAQLIRRLRQKVGASRVQTIPGRGYRYIT